MGKRRAEPLLCPVPCKRPPPRPAARAAALPAAPRAAAKRQLEEAEAPPGKRPGLRGGSGGPRGEQAEAAARRPRRGGQEEEFCQYNSFLYWRAPLPTLDLSDIQDLEAGSPSPSVSLSRNGLAVPETKTPSRTDTMETEMET
ncbi:uncharacterized protein C9orf40 homolog [Eudromia elegans]